MQTVFKKLGNELDSVFKLEKNDRDGYFISSTPTRAQTLKRKCSTTLIINIQ